MGQYISSRTRRRAHLIESPQDLNDGALVAASVQIPKKEESTSPTRRRRAAQSRESEESLSRNYSSTKGQQDHRYVTNVNEEHNELVASTKTPMNENGEWSDVEDNEESKTFQKNEVISCKSCTLTACVSYPSMDKINMEYDPQDDDDEPTEESDLKNKIYERNFHIVTTAALPWFTGTAVNPLLRAAYLLRRSREDYESQKSSSEMKEEPRYSFRKSWVRTEHTPEQTISNVTLVIPWLIDEKDRKQVYGSRKFDREEDQEFFIRSWLRESAHLPEEAHPITGIKIMFYPSRYHSGLGSIFAMGDICSLIHDEDADVCILEEPEHLNWYKAPSLDNWPNKFRHVVGIIHTNYKAYAWSTLTGILTAPAIELISKLMAGYCHRIIKLSPVLQEFALEKDVICNVHGVRSEFLTEGQRRSNFTLSKKHMLDDERSNEKNIGKAYFIGKILWAKGLHILLNLEDLYKTVTGSYFEIDIYGNGPEEDEIKRAFHGRKKSNGMTKSQSDGTLWKRRSLQLPKSLRELRGNTIPANFKGRVDHAGLGEKYKVFVNPSITEVLCTTTAEALAMGKFAVVPAHPSNVFFSQFPNCLMYNPNNKLEFVANMRYALTHEPEPLTSDIQNLFTWEKATERLLESSAITKKSARLREIVGKAKRDETITKMHYILSNGSKGDILRKILGAGPASDQVQFMKEKSRNQSCIF